jgi:hypothetical protein
MCSTVMFNTSPWLHPFVAFRVSLREIMCIMQSVRFALQRPIYTNEMKLVWPLINLPCPKDRLRNIEYIDNAVDWADIAGMTWSNNVLLPFSIASVYSSRWRAI